MNRRKKDAGMGSIILHSVFSSWGMPGAISSWPVGLWFPTRRLFKSPHFSSFMGKASMLLALQFTCAFGRSQWDWHGYPAAPWCSCPVAIALENTDTHDVEEEKLGLDTIPASSYSVLHQFENLQEDALTPMLITQAITFFPLFPLAEKRIKWNMGDMNQQASKSALKKHQHSAAFKVPSACSWSPALQLTRESLSPSTLSTLWIITPFAVPWDGWRSWKPC